MKKIFTVIFAALLLSSCSQQKFSDTKKCADIGEEIRTKISDTQEYTNFSDKQRNMYFEHDEYDDFYHVYSSDTNDINEIGIFHASDAESAKELFEDCREYIDEMRKDSRAFIASYAPEELPKLDAAEVKRYGNYIVYTILPDDETTKIHNHLKETLKSE